MDRANRSRLWYRSHDLHRMHAMRPILSLCNVNDLSELLCLASLLTGITLRFAYGFLLWPVRRWTVSVHTRRSFLARNPRSCGLVYHTCSHYGILRMSNVERLRYFFQQREILSQSDSLTSGVHTLCDHNRPSIPEMARTVPNME